MQRLFGVVAVHVQTAGGGAKGEIVLEAVGPEAVERLREAVRRARPRARRGGARDARCPSGGSAAATG